MEHATIKAVGDALFKYIDQLIESGKLGIIIKDDNSVELIGKGPTTVVKVNQVKSLVFKAFTAFGARPPVSVPDAPKPVKSKKVKKS